jgi:hypothetical protein
MSFLLPAFLAGAGLIALPIVLHLLRRQPRERVPFPTLRFLGPQALRDTRRQNLLRWLTLLARCALIILVVLAFARPFWPKPNQNSNRAVIVAVDNSFSMQATGRREALDKWLDEQLASLHDGDKLGVLQLQPTPVWLAPLSDNLTAGRTALHTRLDGYESSHYAAGLSLAAAVLDETPASKRQIIVAGDEQKLAWTNVDFGRTLPAGVELLPAPAAPAPATQAALVNFHATRVRTGLMRLSVTARLFTPEKLKRTVTFYSGDKLLGSLPFDLSAGQNVTQTADFAIAGDTGDLPLRATLDNDDVAADNSAYTVLPPENTRHVLVAAGETTEVDFLAHALASVHGGDLPTLIINPLPPTNLPANCVAVLRGPAPFRGPRADALDKFLANGGGAWVMCDGSPEQNAWLAKHGVKVTAAKITDDGAMLHLRDFDLQHPLFAPFAGRSLAPLLEAQFQVGWALADDDADPLARWPDHTMALAEVRAGSGKLLVTGFADRRATGNWPLQAAFVPFAHNAIVWLGNSVAAQTLAGRVGQRLTLPGEGEWKSLDAPRATTVRKTSGSIIPDTPGIYEFRADGSPRLFAVNVDAEESDLSPWPNNKDFARLVSIQPRSPEKAAAQPLAALAADPLNQVWWWLLAAAVMILGFELTLANRTVP